jgi:sulfatase modifying factor 1
VLLVLTGGLVLAATPARTSPCRLIAFRSNCVDLSGGGVQDAPTWTSGSSGGSNCLNAAADCGSVPYSYYISKYEIANAQYAEFLNAIAGTDPYGLYNTDMGSDQRLGGIIRSGADGSYTYTLKAGFADKPVVFVSWYDAARSANWLDNGEPTGPEGPGTTETGAYTLTGATSISGGRQVGALTFLPTENEWYKAAYYSPGGAYFDPTGTDTQTACVQPALDTGDSANCDSLVVGTVTDVGAYGLSVGPYGTFDQGGNVYEWNETAFGSNRGLRGGSWKQPVGLLAASFPDFLSPTGGGGFIGFRVASVPEPAQLLLALTGGLVLAVVRQRRGQQLSEDY